MGRWSIAVHGGTGMDPKLPAERQEAAKQLLSRYLKLGISALRSNCPAIDIVELIVKELETDPLFNSNSGSALTDHGMVEMEASIMDGPERCCGTVSGLTTVKDPNIQSSPFFKHDYSLIISEENEQSCKQNLYVGNLPGDIREREVEDLFYKCRPIAHIDLKIPPRPPGYAFVEFEEARDAEDAIRGRDGYDFDGHRLWVELAHGGRGRSSSDRHSSYSRVLSWWTMKTSSLKITHINRRADEQENWL